MLLNASSLNGTPILYADGLKVVFSISIIIGQMFVSLTIQSCLVLNNLSLRPVTTGVKFNYGKRVVLHYDKKNLRFLFTKSSPYKVCGFVYHHAAVDSVTHLAYHNLLT